MSTTADSPSSTATLSLSGTLHLFPTASGSNPVMESADLSSDKLLIFLPGLFDGMGSVPYVGALSDELEKMGWSLAQPHLSSAYKAFGRSSLDADTDEIEACVKFFKTQRGKKTIVLMGHSTGCQQSIHYLLSEPARSLVHKVIAQAPVSDKEAFQSRSDFPADFAPLAQQLYDAGERDQLIPGGLEAFCVDTTVYRAWSLACEGGDDDYFSLHNPRPLSTTFGRLPTSTPILFVFAAQDEHTPGGTETQQAQLQQWIKAAPEGLELRGATVQGSHGLSEEGGEKNWGELRAVLRDWLK